MKIKSVTIILWRLIYFFFEALRYQFFFPIFIFFKQIDLYHYHHLIFQEFQKDKSMKIQPLWLSRAFHSCRRTFATNLSNLTPPPPLPSSQIVSSIRTTTGLLVFTVKSFINSWFFAAHDPLLYLLALFCFFIFSSGAGS